MKRSRDSFFELPAEELSQLILKQNYFHDLDLGSVRTGSWVYSDEQPPNYHLLPTFQYLSELDLKNAKCLDIGTYDGMTAFVMSELGAASVAATCQYDLDRFRLVRALKKYESIDYYPETDIAELCDVLELASFDVVVMSAMLHHLTSPLDGIATARRLLKSDGFLIIEAAIHPIDGPHLVLNTLLDEPVFGAPTIWLPTRSSLLGMLSLAAFDVVTTSSLLGGGRARELNYQRITVVAQAKEPECMLGRTSKVAEIHRSGARLGRLSFDDLGKPAKPDSVVSFDGRVGDRTFNIWTDRVSIPLQPAWREQSPLAETEYKIGREADFRRLAAAHPTGAIGSDDVYLLSARYPGEVMPEGMSWGLKQLGNLFILDVVERWGLRDVLEVGAGFNFYFPNHLPKYVNYTALDSKGFYADNLLDLARSKLPRGRAIDGLLGDCSSEIEDSSFDSCISASVLEHVPADRIDAVCRDMFRVLRPGGWAVHSIDFAVEGASRNALIWLECFKAAGFLLGANADVEPYGPECERLGAPLLEPLSIRMRFFSGYQKSIWTKSAHSLGTPPYVTLLVALRKPHPEWILPS